MSMHRQTVDQMDDSSGTSNLIRQREDSSGTSSLVRLEYTWSAHQVERRIDVTSNLCVNHSVMIVAPKISIDVASRSLNMLDSIGSKISVHVKMPSLVLVVQALCAHRRH